MKANISTLDKLLLIKAAKDKQAKEPIVYKIAGTEEQIVINKPDPEEIILTMNSVPKDAPIMDLWDELIYLAMPELHERETLERFNCLENPVGIVKQIFSAGDRAEIGVRIRDIVNEMTIEEIKN